MRIGLGAGFFDFVDHGIGRLVIIDIVDDHIGSRLPAFCTSMGRVLLAYLPQDQLETFLSRVILTQYTPRTINSVDKLRLALRNVRRNGYALSTRSTKSASAPSPSLSTPAMAAS